MDKAEAIARLQQLYGYTEREARFLWLVVHFSGHFTRTQYRTFAGVPRGGRDAAFVEKILALGHGLAYSCGANAHRIHVKHQALYAALGVPNSNHRKAAQNALITKRLLALDFVLAHQDAHYLMDEASRCEHFRTLGIDETVWPRRVYSSLRQLADRPVYFPDRYPLAVSDAGSTTFVYLDEPSPSFSAFRTHVTTYAPLLRSLTTPWQMVFATVQVHKAESAPRVFAEAASAPKEATTDADQSRYFELRRRWEAKDLSGWSVTDHADRARLTQKFAGQTYETRYQSWLTNGGSNAASTPTSSPSTAHLAGSLQIYLAASLR